MGVALLEGSALVGAATMAVAASHVAVTGYDSRESCPDGEKLVEMVRRFISAHGT